MSLVNAKCTNCGEVILIDKNKDAEICSRCNSAFVCEKAIALYNNDIEKFDEKKGYLFVKLMLYITYIIGMRQSLTRKINNIFIFFVF